MYYHGFKFFILVCQVLLGTFALALEASGDVGFAGAILAILLVALAGIYLIGEFIFFLMRFSDPAYKTPTLHSIISNLENAGISQEGEASTLKKISIRTKVDNLVLIFWLMALYPIYKILAYLF